MTTSAIGAYSLRTGAYYDGCVYAYNSKGDFYRFDASDVSSYTNLGSVNLDVETDRSPAWPWTTRPAPCTA